MAFNQPLESDAPKGDFTKHPLLGAIVWLFGGNQKERSSESTSSSSNPNSLPPTPGGDKSKQEKLDEIKNDFYSQNALHKQQQAMNLMTNPNNNNANTNDNNNNNNNNNSLNGNGGQRTHNRKTGKRLSLRHTLPNNPNHPFNNDQNPNDGPYDDSDSSGDNSSSDSSKSDSDESDSEDSCSNSDSSLELSDSDSEDDTKGNTPMHLPNGDIVSNRRSEVLKEGKKKHHRHNPNRKTKKDKKSRNNDGDTNIGGQQGTNNTKNLYHQQSSSDSSLDKYALTMDASPMTGEPFQGSSLMAKHGTGLGFPSNTGASSRGNSNNSNHTISPKPSNPNSGFGLVRNYNDSPKNLGRTLGQSRNKYPSSNRLHSNNNLQAQHSSLNGEGSNSCNIIENNDYRFSNASGSRSNIRNNVRRQSWSDESGQDLVQFFEKGMEMKNSSSSNNLLSAGSGVLRRSSSSSSSATDFQPNNNNESGGIPIDGVGEDSTKTNNNVFLPKKSAIKRSSSILSTIPPSSPPIQQYNQLALQGMSPGSFGESNDMVSSLPKNSPMSKNRSPAGGILGSQGVGVSGGPAGGLAGMGPGNNGKGHISPQWGWYISTTPPVEMFSKDKDKDGKDKKSSNSKKREKKEKNFLMNNSKDNNSGGGGGVGGNNTNTNNNGNAVFPNHTLIVKKPIKMTTPTPNVTPIANAFFAKEYIAEGSTNTNPTDGVIGDGDNTLLDLSDIDTAPKVRSDTSATDDSWADAMPDRLSD